MSSPRFIRRSTGFFAIVGLGMTLGTQAFTTGRTLSPLRQGPPNDITCQAFLKSGMEKDKNKGIDKAGHDLVLYRTKGYYEHASKFPKWIGAVRIKKNTSVAFPNLPEKARGCIYFQPYDVGSVARYAQLWDESGTTPIHKYDNLAICMGHDAHDEDVRPDWKLEPDNCDSMRLMLLTTKGPYTHEWRAMPGRLGVTMVLSELRDSLEKKMQLPTEEINRIMKRTAAEGPWYPCAEFGCCRAYEDE